MDGRRRGSAADGTSVTTEDWSAGATIGGCRYRRGPISPVCVATAMTGYSTNFTNRRSTGWSCWRPVRSVMPPEQPHRRPMAIARHCFSRSRSSAGESRTHLYTPYVDGAPPDLADDHLHGALFPDLDDGFDVFAAALNAHFGPKARLGVDDQTHAMLRGLPDFDWVDAGDVLGAAKIIKTPDELACIRTAQRFNELAMVDALRSLRPGVRQTDLSAVFCAGCRTRRHRRRDRPDLASDGPDQGRRPVDDTR